MRVGLARAAFELESVRYAARSLATILAEQHELCYLQPGFDYSTWFERERAADAMVERCDVVVGFVSDPTVALLLAARQRRKLRVPFIVFVLGAFPRGAAGIRQIAADLTTNDTLVVNCAADADLARRFFSNARIALIPFALEDNVYFPVSDHDRFEIRRQLGCNETTPLVLYAGRITVEKNVHSVIRVFAMVQRAWPDCRLILAGPMLDFPFLECGVVPIGYGRTIANVAGAMQVSPSSLQCVGVVPPDRLRALYNAADVVLNLTLNHDENFGFAQVEALACGTPVVGTAWGGLRDTIREGENGLTVSVVVTPLGVKVNWWEAVNNTLLVLAAHRERSGRERVQRSSRRYLRGAYEAELQSLVAAVTAESRAKETPLRTTTFARRYWDTCLSPESPTARYEPGTPSFALYQRLIQSYASTSAASLSVDAQFEEDQVVSLAMPVRHLRGDLLEIDDPLYPFELVLSRQLLRRVSQILIAMNEQPAITVRHLAETCGASSRACWAPLRWMQARGLVLRSAANGSWLDPHVIDNRMSQPLFSKQRVALASTDFLLF